MKYTSTGYKLKVLSQRMGYKQVELSKKICTNPVTLSKFFHGEGTLHHERFIKLLIALDIININEIIENNLNNPLSSSRALIDSLLETLSNETRKNNLLKILPYVAKNYQNEEQTAFINFGMDETQK